MLLFKKSWTQSLTIRKWNTLKNKQEKKITAKSTEKTQATSKHPSRNNNVEGYSQDYGKNEAAKNQPNYKFLSFHKPEKSALKVNTFKRVKDNVRFCCNSVTRHQ